MVFLALFLGIFVLPLLVLVEFMFEILQKESITIKDRNFKAPSFYLELVSEYTNVYYKKLFNKIKSIYKKIHELHLLEKFNNVLVLFWLTTRKITKLFIYVFLPIHEIAILLEKNNIPKLRRSKRFREDKTIFDNIKSSTKHKVDDQPSTTMSQIFEEANKPIDLSQSVSDLLQINEKIKLYNEQKKWDELLELSSVPSNVLLDESSKKELSESPSPTSE